MVLQRYGSWRGLAIVVDAQILLQQQALGVEVDAG